MAGSIGPEGQAGDGIIGDGGDGPEGRRVRPRKSPGIHGGAGFDATGKSEEFFSFDEVIADRTRFPACREPGQGVGTNQAGSGWKTLRDPRIVS